MMESDLRNLIKASRPSVVLSQARASLLNPSRPVTPMVSERRLFDHTDSERFEKLKKRTCKETKSKEEKIEEKKVKKIPSLSESTATDVFGDIQLFLKQLKMTEKSNWDHLLTKLCPMIDKLTAIIDSKTPTVIEEAMFLRNNIVDVLIDHLKKDEVSVLCRIRLCASCIRLSDGEFDQHLEQVCEIVHSLASEKIYDDLFRQEGLLEVMVHTLLPLNSAARHTYLVYALGSLRFVSQDNVENQSALAKSGAIQRLARLIKDIVKSSSQDIYRQIAMQGVLLLRCMLEEKRRQPQFFQADIPAILLKYIQRHPTDYELTLVCTRVLSKVTTSSKAREKLECIPFIRILDLYYQHEFALCLRVCFILGNLTASNVENRRQLVADGTSIEILVKVIEYHSKSYIDHANTLLRMSSVPDKMRKELRDREDLLLKVIRVVANVSIDDNAGYYIVHCASINVIINVLKVASTEEIAKLVGENGKQEELTLNIISCITNLSFYEDEADEILQSSKALQVLLPFLFSGNHELVLESLKVLGNFSRYSHVRNWISRYRVDEAVLVLLEHIDRDIVLAACGVLTNLVSESETAHLVDKLQAIPCLINIIRRIGVSDFELSCRILMMVSNYLTSNSLGKELSLRLENTLFEFKDIARDILNDDDAADAALFIQVGEKTLKLLHRSNKK